MLSIILELLFGIGLATLGLVTFISNIRIKDRIQDKLITYLFALFLISYGGLIINDCSHKLSDSKIEITE